jgi:hypothetical protein
MGYKKFTQVAYIPTHAKGDIDHPDVQFGFITSIRDREGYYFVRYWRAKYSPELRTKANGERTHESMLVKCKTHMSEEISREARELGLC